MRSLAVASKLSWLGSSHTMAEFVTLGLAQLCEIIWEEKESTIFATKKHVYILIRFDPWCGVSIYMYCVWPAFFRCPAAKGKDFFDVAQISLSLTIHIMVRSTFLTASLLSVAASLTSAACVKRSGNSSSSGLVAATYFAGYHIDDGFPVSSISWNKYTEVKYAFA